MLNANKGRGLIDEAEDTARLSTEADKITRRAEGAADIKALSKHAAKAPKEAYYIRSYRMSHKNLLRMDALKAKIGSDFNFQINKALESWFEKNYPEISV
jgi:hypothetical protein